MPRTTRYEKFGSAGILGALYQINLLTIVLLNAMRKVRNWRLSTENRAAARWSDLVFEFLPSESAILLVTKHKEDEGREITYKDLMSANMRSEFSLPKYFLAYQEVKSRFRVQNVVICTNLTLDEKTKSVLREESVDPESVLHFEGAENICYGFSGCSFPELKQSIKTYQTKFVRNNEVSISDEDINDFLNHLKFFPNCLRDRNVENIIQQTISRGNFAEDLNIETIQASIFTKMTDWFKEKRGRYLTEVEAKAFFCDLRSNKYCEDLKLYDVRFKRNNLPLILQTLQTDAPTNDPKRISHIIPDKEYVLNVVKIYQALPTNPNERTLFVNPDETVEVQSQIIDAFEVPLYTILVMVCPKEIGEAIAKEMRDKIMDILDAHKYKHVILIADERNSLAAQLRHANINEYEVMADSITFADLEETTQEAFKRKKLISFQGSNMSLEDLFTLPTADDLNEIANLEILIKFAQGDRIEVGRELPRLDNNYIRRSFNRDGQSIPEEDLWGSTEIGGVKVVLISGSDGAGKSSVLVSLGNSIKREYPHLWVVQLDLKQYADIMKRTLREGRGSVSVIELLNSQETSKFKSEFGKKLFTTPNRVVLLLDGVDEVSPTYAELVRSLITDSLARGNLTKIFVVARPEDFENVPSLQSLTLEPFSEGNNNK